MFCSNCGTKLPDDASFCPECGTKIEKAAEEAVVVEAEKVEMHPAAQPAEVKEECCCEAHEDECCCGESHEEECCCGEVHEEACCCSECAAIEGNSGSSLNRLLSAICFFAAATFGLITMFDGVNFYDVLLFLAEAGAGVLLMIKLDKFSFTGPAAVATVYLFRILGSVNLNYFFYSFGSRFCGFVANLCMLGAFALLALFAIPMLINKKLVPSQGIFRWIPVMAVGTAVLFSLGAHPTFLGIIIKLSLGGVAYFFPAWVESKNA